ncbi:M1 family metallopeptidase [Streptomyces lonegramiae]|uniref:Aminopeptidase N n=1 Tax=Streptomyces lonegramiae TaxID=3075524 RepID=A0ABU2XNN8_9ACTN|nr:M1 family metallopeptidase [Streptomyces sp. DSM 41529]MDT0547064.1 M1 family metallopeptidase [Streptomyces sp. DSM 41529]
MRTRPSPRPLPAALALLLCAACTGGSGARDTADDVPGAKPGAAGVGDPLFPKLGNGGYDVTRYRLTLDYAPDSGRLKGTAEISARTTRALTSFHLDLAGLRVREARVDGKPARTARSGTELTLTPAAALPKGRAFKTTVVYDGKPRTIKDPDGSEEGWIKTADGALAVGEPTGSMAWFPGNHHPSDKAAYDITITVPQGYTAVSNGELARRSENHDRTTFHWRTDEPMASYLATVAIDDFDIHTTTTDGTLPQYVAIDPELADRAAEVPDQVTEVIDWESRTFGRYPFSSTGAIVADVPDLGYALETQTKPLYPSPPSEPLIVHELAHQWFGNSVTPRTWKDMWLNEGFATYAEWLWEEDHNGRTAQEIFDDFYDGTDDESEGIWDFPPAAPPSAGRVSDPPVYGRGAMVLHKVREAVGDKTFFAILRAWTRDHRHGNADTAQFIALCEKKYGKDLQGLFDIWLYGDGKPKKP